MGVFESVKLSCSKWLYLGRSILDPFNGEEIQVCPFPKTTKVVTDDQSTKVWPVEIYSICWSDDLNQGYVELGVIVDKQEEMKRAGIIRIDINDLPMVKDGEEFKTMLLKESEKNEEETA